MRPTFPWIAGLLLAAWLGMTKARAEAADGGFSEPKEIEKRLNATRAELAALPQDADPDLSDALQRIVASGEYHLSSIGVLAAMRDQLAQAKTESSSWKGFPSPPPYSVRLLDEVRESLATLENSQRISEAQIGIFKREIESLGELRASHVQTERRFLEAADAQNSADLKTQDSRSAKNENLKARLVAEKIGRRQIQVATIEAQLAASTSRKELAARKLKALGVRFVFTRHELDGILKQVTDDRNQAATREVSRVLLAVAASHGLVMKDPPPEVRFDKFGTNSLHFTLLFWLDSRKIARNQLASDLRYMIDGAFAEAGIVVAFPQRDIHFNSDKPLRVELSRPTGIPPV